MEIFKDFKEERLMNEVEIWLMLVEFIVKLGFFRFKFREFRPVKELIFSFKSDIWLKFLRLMFSW